jgi:2,4-dienoyl-CoA reductase-like NADH-dependent reductase (Old Yellow Enzyme family)
MRLFHRVAHGVSNSRLALHTADVVDAFGHAATRRRCAGGRVVMLQFAQEYLLNQFLSPLTNQAG